jgi:uncharacterized membrane protein (DUF2068 family)
MRSSTTGLKSIAIVEALKGAVVLLAAAGAVSLVHENAQVIADEIVRHFHLNPASHYPRIFLDAVKSLNSSRLWMLAIGACFYAAIRFIEAYGLWHERTWAEWFGVISGAIYLPVEIYELFLGFSFIKFALLATNLLVVGILARAIQRSRHRQGAFGQVQP